jgi:hypothetical protein
MIQSHEITAATLNTTVSGQDTSVSPANGCARETVAATVRASTKDAGRVHIGGGMMRFGTTKDAGRVHVGGGMMRF